MNFNVITVNGKAVPTYDKATDIRPDVYNALNIRKRSPTQRGSWFMFPDFGLDLSNIKVVTNETVALFKQEIEKALAYLIDALKVARLVVTTEVDPQDRNRINARIEIIQLSQIPMLFVAFVCVGGPSPEFSVT